MNQAPRAMVISLQKAGTHLMQGLMLELGYKMAGVPRPASNNTPEFRDEQRKAIAALTLCRRDYDQLLETQGTAEFIYRTDEAWAALGWHWQRRLGQHVVNRYGRTRLEFADAVVSNSHLPYTKFADTPSGLCWIFHELTIAGVDGSFLSEWVDTGDPPLIFNFRDPRDTVISMINFLEGRTREGYGNFYEFDIFSRILASKPNWEAKIDYALRDPCFLARNQFAPAIWLLNHPKVCQVRYEDLIGPDGGGTRERQIDAVTRILRHVRSGADPVAVAERVYNPGSWSFYRGKSGGWRERFTDANIDLFNELFGDILVQYGYE